MVNKYCNKYFQVILSIKVNTTAVTVSVNGKQSGCLADSYQCCKVNDNIINNQIK